MWYNIVKFIHYSFIRMERVLNEFINIYTNIGPRSVLY